MNRVRKATNILIFRLDDVEGDLEEEEEEGDTSSSSTLSDSDTQDTEELPIMSRSSKRRTLIPPNPRDSPPIGPRVYKKVEVGASNPTKDETNQGGQGCIDKEKSYCPNDHRGEWQ